MPDQERDYSLVMPFVVCASKGGPFDDESFVAGYECGIFAEQLKSRSPSVTSISTTVHSGNVPQLDLLAMREGWRMTAKESEVDGWTYVTFDRSPAHAQ